MSHDELTYRIAFASVRGMGIDLATKLLEVVGSERDFFEMNERELRALTGGRRVFMRNIVCVTHVAWRLLLYRLFH